jgi:alpha-mannosidase
MKRLTIKRLISICCLTLFSVVLTAQTAYFIDGYHGGVYGHYPEGQTGFIVNKLNEHPDWDIVIEIEPETWDVVRERDPEAYAAFKALFKDQSVTGRIEYVNPSYAQSFLYNISGESVIRQF